MFKRRTATPSPQRELLGVAISQRTVSLVSVVWNDSNDVMVPFANSVDVQGEDVGNALKTLLDEYRTGGGSCTVCVLGLGNDSWMVEPFELRPGNDLRATLQVELERVQRFDGAPVRITLAAGANCDPGKYLIGFVREDVLNERVALAEGVGLQVDAVDFEACAWRRTAPECDVIIVQQPDSATGADSVLVCGYSDQNIRMRRLEKVSLAIVGSKVAESITRMEHDRVVRNIKSIAVLSDDAFFKAVKDSKPLKGIAVERLTCLEEEMPPWALAYGLALYGFAEEVDGEVAYAI